VNGEGRGKETLRSLPIRQSCSLDEIRRTVAPRALDFAEPVLSEVEGLHPGYSAVRKEGGQKCRLAHQLR
jgi:hypothetical protein